jgi:hypothetical protein
MMQFRIEVETILQQKVTEVLLVMTKEIMSILILNQNWEAQLQAASKFSSLRLIKKILILLGG